MPVRKLRRFTSCLRREINRRRALHVSGRACGAVKPSFCLSNRVQAGGDPIRVAPEYTQSNPETHVGAESFLRFVQKRFGF
jgi:hypothetical protein